MLNGGKQARTQDFRMGGGTTRPLEKKTPSQLYPSWELSVPGRVLSWHEKNLIRLRAQEWRFSFFIGFAVAHAEGRWGMTTGFDRSEFSLSLLKRLYYMCGVPICLLWHDQLTALFCSLPSDVLCRQWWKAPVYRYRHMTIEILHLLFPIEVMPWDLPQR